MSLSTQLLQKPDFVPQLRSNLFQIFEKYYQDISFDQFNEDLSRKDYALVLKDSCGQLRGFSTIEFIAFEFKGQKYHCLFSGDTIIEKEFWGELSLPFEWCKFAGEIKSKSPNIPLLWFLIVKGHRTYRLMSLLAKEYYPSWRAKTPESIQELMNYLGSMKFGQAYNSKSGVIRFSRSKGALKKEYSEVSEAYQQKEDVSFFFNSNPGYLKGDELLCLCELKLENLRSIARRGFEASLR